MALGRRLREAAEDHTRAGRRKKTRSKEWLHHVDVSDFLERLEIMNIAQATKDEINFSCPFPGHANADMGKPSAYMNDGSNDKEKATAWKCHGCGRVGNAITFYAEHEGVTKGEAAQTLREVYAPNFRAPKGGTISAEFELRMKERMRERENKAHDVPVIPYERYRELFAVDWQEFVDSEEPDVRYLLDRGFTVDSLNNWDIGYDEISDRLTIPVRNIDGDIVGVKGRTWKPKKQERVKYRILGDKEGKGRARYGFAPYEKSLVVFGLDRITGEEEHVVLVEGELDVIALWQIDIPAISTGSAHLSEAQARLVRDYCDEVIVFFDSNTAGKNAALGYFDDDGDFHPGVLQLLSPFIHVKVVGDHGDDDASKMVEEKRTAELRKMLRRAVPAHRLLLEV